jgi:hypothetical protein
MPSNIFANQSSEQLADEYGANAAAIAKIEARQKLLKQEFIDRGTERVEGPAFTVTVSTSSRTSLDMDAVKAALGKKLEKFQKSSETTTVRVKATVIAEGVGV